MSRLKKFRSSEEKTMASVGVFFTILILLLVGGYFWSYLDRHDFFNEAVRTARCHRNMARIVAAKVEYQKEWNSTNGTPMKAEMLVDYVEGGWVSLKCPSGGAYTIGPIGQPPACSKHESGPK